MAKKLGKALIFTAVAGAVVAGGMAVYNKYKASTDDFDDDFLDFDDEDDDFDDDFLDDLNNKKSGREYVSIPRDNKSDDSSDDCKVDVDVKIVNTLIDDEDDTNDLNDSKKEQDTNEDSKILN